MMAALRPRSPSLEATDSGAQGVSVDTYEGSEQAVTFFQVVPEQGEEPPPDAEPAAILDPTEGIPGTEVTVTGSGWPPGDTIAVWWDTKLAETTADSNGNMQVSFIVPADAAEGEYDVDIRDEEPGMGGIDVRLTFRVTPPSEGEGEIDIVATGIDVLTQPIYAGTVTFRAFLRNNGSKESGFFSIQWIVDNSQSFDGGHPSEPAGADGSHDIPFTDLPPGEHTLEFIADYDNQIPEIDENNNTATLTFTAEDCSDTEPPTVSWVKPDGIVRFENLGQSYEAYPATKGPVALEVAVSDNAGIHSVLFERWDEVNQQWVELTTDSSAPYQASVEVSMLSMEWNQIRAVAEDTAGNLTHATLLIERCIRY
jgi:CARDB